MTAAGTSAELSAALSAAACLIATAALVRAADAAGVADVRVVVAEGQISLQVPLGAGDQPTRIEAVASYARVLGSRVADRDTRIGARGQTWVETSGQIHAHHVHVWTITDPNTSGSDPRQER